MINSTVIKGSQIKRIIRPMFNIEHYLGKNVVLLETIRQTTSPELRKLGSEYCSDARLLD